jgi:triosephosphate isomerase
VARQRPIPERRPLVSGNWKMHHDHIEALHTVRDLGLRLKPEDLETVDVSVHPPFCDLRTVQTVVEGEGIPVALGAQHCSDKDRGAFTGEVSPLMLARLGVTYVIVGHSERRQLFGMSDATVSATIGAVLRHGMTPVICVGETAAERDQGSTEERVGDQVEAALGAVTAEQARSAVFAYEPIWAIGTGRAATTQDAQRGCAFVRAVAAKVLGDGVALSLRVQYGGSVTAENAGELCGQPDVDGLLVGGASLQAPSFVDVIRAVGGCYRS